MLHGSHSLIVIAVVVAARVLLQRGMKLRPRRREGRSRRPADPDPHRRGPIRLVLHQARYELLALMRNRQARYATVLLPLLLLVLMVGVAGDNRVGPQHAQASSYYVPGLAALAIIASSFVNLVISVVGQREAGVLKRRRATPVPTWALIAGRSLCATAVAAAVTIVLVAVGRLAFGLHFAAVAIPGIAVTALAGAACFCALAYAVAGAIRSADAAQPAIQALMLPLYLGSGIFIPDADLPAWLRQIAALFPVERLADGLRQAFQSHYRRWRPAGPRGLGRRRSRRRTAPLQLGPDRVNEVSISAPAVRLAGDHPYKEEAMKYMLPAAGRGELERGLPVMDQQQAGL